MIPFGHHIIFIDFSIGVFFFFGITICSVVPLGFLMVGYESNNFLFFKNGLQAIVQSISYKIPLVFMCIIYISTCNSLKYTFFFKVKSNLS